MKPQMFSQGKKQRGAATNPQVIKKVSDYKDLDANFDL